MPDTAALLHGQRGILDARENGAEVVVDLAEHKAVEKGNGAARTGAGEDTPGRQEAEVGHGAVEALGPLLACFLTALLAAAAARATRQNVSSSENSALPPSALLRRYLRSHISREMGAENSASSRMGASCCSAREYGVEEAQSQ